jgi:endonuclease YncB( thermonuclease family)
VALCLAALLLGLPAVAFGAEQFRGKVVGVSDGDTITVMRDRHPEKVRLHGIDAPEKGQPFADRARQFTARLAFDQEVTVRASGRDRYRRWIAEIVLPDGRSLNRELVRAGYAWWYRRYSADSTLGFLESQARSDRVGLWAGPNPVPPWEWRSIERSTIRQ